MVSELSIQEDMRRLKDRGGAAKRGAAKRGAAKRGAAKVSFGELEVIAVAVVMSCVDELLLQRKSHGSTWLIGRCANPDKRSTSGPTDSEITYLTIKIRQEVVNEMEEKKVRENLTWVLMKLSEANPSININLTELCATISSDNDNDTHATS
ncbi:hypothetical protein POM88_023545 [Heracleum sosnowskyi]|uniref:Uncharacterized protein n=1 Tax=Heracleum sosnowskyi TaxID=360622 RepID=A0AAD8IKZ2_9APIA|nr:hypothetical protein POM88_023545 [Heracleum sosnowskyi]